MSARPTAIVALPARIQGEVFSARAGQKLAEIADLVETRGEQWARLELPPAARVLITGWESPPVTPDVLDRLPNLELILHSAGSVRGLLDPHVWERGIQVSTAAAANNRFVADYTAAQILLALKGVHHTVAHGRVNRRFSDAYIPPGSRGQTVGLVSYGSIARFVRQRLAAFDSDVLVWDPFIDDHVLAVDNVRRAESLVELFETSQVVSLHTPLIPRVTEGIIDGELLARLRLGATFINTARGALIDEAALLRLLSDRTDLTAILDVTWPEPPAAHSELWDLPNVQLTGHVAGAVGSERLALGDHVIDELSRYLAGEPLGHGLSAEQAAGRA